MLAVDCYKIIATIQAAIHIGHIPNVQAIAGKLCSGSNHAQTSETQQKLIDYAYACVKPGIQYFQIQLTTGLCQSLSMFKEARLFYPHK